MAEYRHIPVFLASDDNYAPFAATMMYSVLEHTDAFIDFYVLDGGISDGSKILIAASLAAFEHKSLTYFDMSAYGLERFPNVRHYSLNAFSRYFIPELRPELAKIIYLDVDIIVKGDIAELYDEDMDGYPVAAVLEDFYAGNWTMLKEKIYPQYNGGDRYFNTGVLLLDIPQLIAGNYTDKMIKLTVELSDKLNCPDQDVFNILFENNFKVLDYRYNFMPGHWQMLQEKHPEIKTIAPFAIHYTAGKPWRGSCEMKEEFDRVLRETYFATLVKDKFQERQKDISYSVRLFAFIPLLKIAVKRNRIYVKLFGVLPLYKITQKHGKAKHYLFGVLPWLVIKDKN